MDFSRKETVNIVVNNKLASAKARIGMVAVLAVAIILLSYSLFYGIEREQIVFILGVIGFSIYVFRVTTKPHYIYLATDSSKLILRFYNSHVFMSKPRAIQIPKNAFVGFEIEKSLFGFKKDLYVIQATQNGDVKYPPVSISLLNKNEEEAMIKTLEGLQKRK